MTGRYPERDMSRCPSCGATVAAGAAFCQECGTRLPEWPAPEYAPSEYTPPEYVAAHPTSRRSSMPTWIVPAFIATAIVALGLGALLAVFLGGPDPDQLAGASATPTPSATSSASDDLTDASATPTPTATPEPTPTPEPAFANRSILEVTIGGLNLRTQAGTDSTVIGELGQGARVFTIGAPQDIGAERWYRVAFVSGPYSRCEPQFCPRDLGYVAEGLDADDGPYLREADLDCPSSPMTADALNALDALERLSCYGGNPIVVTGTLDHCYCDGPIVVEYEPSWLAAPVSLFLFDGTDGLWLRFEDEELEPEDLEAGDVVEATVAMEHPASTDCTVSGPGDDHPTTAEIVLACRTQIVVESLTVTGHDEAAVGP